MTNQKDAYSREHRRAPLMTTVLYVDEGYVFNAKTLNISEGGILIEELPHFPTQDLIPIMLEVPKYPDFSKFTDDSIHVDELDYEKKIIRMMGRIVRTYKGNSPVDKVFVQRIGCLFENLSDVNREIIQEFIKSVSKNMENILGLFESFDDQNEERINNIRMMVGILGYDVDQDIRYLRQKLIHDYQSLKSS